VSEWLKVIVPILITGLGAVVIGLFNDVKDIRSTQLEGKTWIYRIEQNEVKIKALELQCSKITD